MKKRHIVLIIIVVLAIVLIILSKVLKPNVNNLVQEAMETNGYVLNKETEIYEKLISELDEEEYNDEITNGNNAELDIFKFNDEFWTLTEIVSEFENEINYDLVMSYDYKNETFEYTYRISDNENINIILRGNSLDKYVIEYQYGVDELDINEYFESIKEDLIIFKKEYLNIIKSNEIRKSLNNSK